MNKAKETVFLATFAAAYAQMEVRNSSCVRELQIKNVSERAYDIALDAVENLERVCLDNVRRGDPSLDEDEHILKILHEKYE